LVEHDILEDLLILEAIASYVVSGYSTIRLLL